MKYIFVNHHRSSQIVRVNLKSIVERNFIKTPNQLATFICQKYDWKVENPRMQRLTDNVVCNEWDDLKDCNEYEIAELASSV